MFISVIEYIFLAGVFGWTLSHFAVSDNVYLLYLRAGPFKIE